MFGESSSSLVTAAMAGEAKRRQCIADYHAMLEHIDLSEFAGSLHSDMDEHNIKYGDRPVCPFLRPSFVTKEQLELLKARVNKVATAMQIIVEYVLHDETLQNFLGLTDIEKELISFAPGYSGISTTARFDSFLNGGSCHFVEYNAESPAGIGYSDTMSQLFKRRPEFCKFAEEHNIKAFDISKELFTTIMRCWEEWSGGKTKPVIAIADFAGVPTRHEFYILQKYFEAHGCRTIVTDHRNFEYNGEYLSFEGQKIDVLYRRVLVSEFVEKIDEAQALYNAVKDGKICMVNSFRSKILHKKAIFAILTDSKYHDLLTAEQIGAIKDTISWTRRLVDCQTTDPDNKNVELLDYVCRNRRNLVLKPNDSYGGHGIYFGWEQSESEWRNSVNAALEHDYLVQTRIPVARELFPSWSKEKGLEWGEYTVDLDPYAFNYRMSGATARLSLSSLCNVTSGGGSLPCFVIN
ncbi:MAG: hypothetical protein ACI38Q_09105 [Candidatus Bruticola sp.]